MRSIVVHTTQTRIMQFLMGHTMQFIDMTRFVFLYLILTAYCTHKYCIQREI